MRQLLPTLGDVDPVTTYLAADRPAPADRPWVAVGMIASVDGATTVEGRSGPLGAPADEAMFRAVRGIADVVLVGAGTIRAEGYGAPRLSPHVRAAREAAGRAGDPPRLAVVSASLSLDLSSRPFTDEGPRPLVLTTTDADPDRRARVAEVAEVHAVGAGRVDVGGALARLHALGAGVVVSEGGPRLNGALVDADVVDEWCVSISPVVAGGDSARLVEGAGPARSELVLGSLLEGDGLLFGRWVRVPGPTPPGTPGAGGSRARSH